MAQLGARFHGMEEVVSSNLTRSTKFLPASVELQPFQAVPVSHYEVTRLLVFLRGLDL